jgi:2,3-bisphosphoglycerate-independent phosphoglycerate mutase
MATKKIILIIMDGWGLGKVASSDAIQNAKTPFVSSLYSKYPNTTLITCGEAVGLPDGQMGNSDGSFAKNEILLNAIRFAKKNNKPLHLLGLVSNGGVHSHIDHLKAITDVCKNEKLSEVFIHAFTDGRDCDPKSGLGFIKELQEHLNGSVGKIASVSGRYYAMDRDKRWERIRLAYDALVNGVGEKATDAIDAVENSYSKNITDEFIKPTVIIAEDQQPLAKIKDDDVAICFNFRTDRCREITQVLTQMDLPDHDMKKLSLDYTTMTEYDKTYKDVNVIFETDNLNNTLGEILEQHGLKQIRIAETEKYPHVSFFFSGGREKPFDGEKRIMIASPKVATYDLKPEMSAFEVTEALLPEIKNKTADFICLNYANADMVGHTGVWEAAIKAVETVDKCVSQVVTTGLENGYTTFLTADHGNSDYMINEDGSPNTAHTMNLVPFFIIDKDWKGKINPGKLGDIAPTILTMMQLPIPKEMTGEILISQP